MSLYTPEIRRLHKSIVCKHPGLIWDVIEYEDYLTMCLYRDNFDSLPQYVREYIANEFVPQVMQLTWDAGAPIFMEVRDVAG